MHRTCLLAAALLLTGCDELKRIQVDRHPLAIGSEVFMNEDAVRRLNKICDAYGELHYAVGTKVRVVPGGFDDPPQVRAVVLEGPYAGVNVMLLKNEVYFAP